MPSDSEQPNTAKGHLALPSSRAPCGDKADERFTYEPRVPYTPEGSEKQRHFGRDNCDRVAGVARVFRFTDRDTATLDLSTPYSEQGIRAEFSARMTVNELRELAQRLLDAAHHIQSVPAVVNEGVTA